MPACRVLARPLVALTLLALVVACATNPVTGRQQLALVTEQQEIAMGQEAAKQVEASIGLYDDQELQDYVANLGKRLAADSERPNLPWSFKVVDDAAVNAFALPGGPIYVTRGLVTHLNSEAELVAVLGHEIGHVTARHAVSQISKAQAANVLGTLAMIFVPQARPYGDLLQTGTGLMFLKFSRSDERQADEIGLRYLISEGYDPRPMSEVFSVLQRVSEAESGGKGRLPNWLSSHPDPGSRREFVEKALRESGRSFEQAKINRDGYLRHIDGVVFGDNPREGYFEQSLFHHPELRFRIDFPAGWKTVNQKTAVGAISPNQDAAVVLTLAGEPSVAAAAQKFFSQQGVERGQTWRNDINGMDAVSAIFAVQTQQGTLQGLVGFVEHGGKVYQLIGYTPQQRFRNYEDEFARSLASFDREDDPEVLAVKPRRVDVVSLQRDTTVEEFARSRSTSVPVETLALINHVAPNGSLPGGELVKAITGGNLPQTLSRR